MLPHILSCSSPSVLHPALQLEGSSAAGVYITGFATSPEAAPTSRAEQYIYINRRSVRCEQISKLLESLHSQLQPLERLSAGHSRSVNRNADTLQRGGVRTHPAYVLFINCPTAMIDVLAGPDSTQALSSDWSPILDATRSVMLSAWKEFVPDRVLQWQLRAESPCPTQNAPRGGRGHSEPVRTGAKVPGPVRALVTSHWNPSRGDSSAQRSSQGAGRVGGMCSSAPSIEGLSSEKRAAWYTSAEARSKPPDLMVLEKPEIDTRTRSESIRQQQRQQQQRQQETGDGGSSDSDSD